MSENASDATRPSAEFGAGYDERFLGPLLAFPTLNDASRKRAHRLQQPPDPNRPWIIPHTRFSVAFDLPRKLPRVSAWNIGTGNFRNTTRSFAPDPFIPPECQLLQAYYGPETDFERGHIAPMDDLSWGDRNEAARAQRESCYFSNIAPQLSNFNKSRSAQNWGDLEKTVRGHGDQGQAPDQDPIKLSVWGGPVLLNRDRRIQEVKVPRAFWKAIFWASDQGLMVLGFKLEQDLTLIGDDGNQQEIVRMQVDGFDAFAVAQRTVWELELMSGLVFPPNLILAPLDKTLSATSMRLETSDQIIWPEP
jgi:endonuclease G